MEVSLQDTLHISQINANSNLDNKWDKRMPWIAAMIVGLLSLVVNIIVALILKHGNEINLTKQLDNAKEMSFTQIKADIALKNRQEWIDKVRENLCEFITQGSIIQIEMSSDDTDSKKVFTSFEKMNYCKSNIAMLLNNDQEDQKPIIDDVYKIVESCFKLDKKDYSPTKYREQEDKLISHARTLLTKHWEKVKKLEY
jgi:hypothetical protein